MKCVERALTTWTASVEAQLREQAPRTKQEHVAEINRGAEMFVTRMVEQKWQARMGQREPRTPPEPQSPIADT
eukprot:12236944-Prorocentrum_lima.AAC.1